jgi:3'-phosphoadenosine 5'-phosphosulfate sulfotransferase (PAPS reductase)/FAD synthetase
MTSGGLVSWATAEVVIERFGLENVTCLFADTLIEDEDLYRFLDETTETSGVEFVRVADGRTPWEVFEDEKFIGNSRIDPCSRILKREITRRWLSDNCDPEDTIVHIGFSWDEQHRFDRALPYWDPWKVSAPLTEEGWQWTREEILERLSSYGIAPPRLYDLGFAHNNCGGFCVKAGHAQFKLLLEKIPHRYAEHERAEAKAQGAIGTDRTVLRCRRGGVSKPISLTEFRERLVQEGKIDDEYDWGGCGCFYPVEYYEDSGNDDK